MPSRHSKNKPLQTDHQALLVKALTSIANAVFITDEIGRIIWINEAFSRLSGYSTDDVVGCTPAILQSGKQNQEFYARLWQTILAGHVWQGEVVDRRKDGTLYTVDEVITPLFDTEGAITNFIAIQHDITMRKQEGERDHYLAYHDAATGLPNRTYFLNVLQRAISHADRVRNMLATLFLDLDGFKPVNDTFGHQTGDQLLAALAERLSSAVRKEDVVARFGGDEFAILLTDLSGTEAITSLAEKLLEVVSQPFLIQGQRIHVSASIGISVYPVDSDEAQTLLDHADQAMYDAKRHGGNNFRFHTTSTAQTLLDGKEARSSKNTTLNR